MDGNRREYVANIIRSEFEQSLQQRIDRYLSIGHQPIIGKHYFSDASAECVNLFRDGHFIACITLTQSVAEGIVKFVRDRNGVAQVPDETRQALAARMKEAGLVSQEFVNSLARIHRSFRDDFHHMNPKVAQVEVEPLARRNIVDLAVMEREIFACSTSDGMVVPLRPLYWDVDPSGCVPVYLRPA